MEDVIFDLKKYLGNWCIILSSSRESISYPDWFIRNDNYNVEITYESVKNNNISISVSMVNNSRRFSKLGRALIIDNNSFRIDFLEEDMRQISTNPEFIRALENASFVEPNHVIEKIWIDEKDRYIFALIVNPLNKSFYLLSRDPYPRLSIYNIIIKYILEKHHDNKMVQMPYFI